MAAKKAPAKKMASTPKSPTTTTPPTPRGMAQALPKKIKPGAALGKAIGTSIYEKGVLTEAAKRNQKYRKEAERSGLDFGLINVTYRNTKGKLENSVVNRARGTAFPKDDVVYLNNKDKPNFGAATGKAISASMARKAKKK